jgi:hypothetical protein
MDYTSTDINVEKDERRAYRERIMELRQQVDREAFFKDLVAALRSGKYKQAKGTLREKDGDEGYCCLGVTCDIFPAGRWTDEWAYEFAGTWSTGVLPTAIGDVLDMDTCGRLTREAVDYAFEQCPDELSDKDRQSVTQLTHLNDAGVPFSVIADIIEKFGLPPRRTYHADKTDQGIELVAKS